MPMLRMQETPNQSIERRLLHGLSRLLHPAGAERAPEQTACGRDAGGYRPVPGEPWPGARAGVRCPWPGETPLSYAEVEHGLREGVL